MNENIRITVALILIISCALVLPNIKYDFKRYLNPGRSSNLSPLRYSFEQYIEEVNPIPTSGRRVYIGLFSTNGRAKNREMARSTYLSMTKELNNMEIHYVFVFGSKRYYSQAALDEFAEEEAKYGDMLFLDSVLDSYKNMSLKVYHFYKHISELKDHYDYVMKMDDDSYLNVNVFSSVVPLLPPNWFHYAFFWYDVGKEKNTSKYYDSLYKLGTRYLVYSAGPGHLFSMDIVKFISNLEKPLIVQNDDVNADLWTYGLKILRIHDDRFFGGFNLCCKASREETLDFLILINLRSEQGFKVHSYVTNETSERFTTKSLDFFDCRCYATDYLVEEWVMWIGALLGVVILGVEIIKTKGKNNRNILSNLIKYKM